jgi:hypothetical protein
VPWIFFIVVIVGVIALTRGFIINAKALMRDVNQRRDACRARLEHDATVLVDDFLAAIEAHRGQPSPPTARE